MSKDINKRINDFLATEKHHVRCTVCGMELRTRLWSPGDTHKADGGEFIRVLGVE